MLNIFLKLEDHILFAVNYPPFKREFILPTINTF